jgi:hypothetical protein
MNEHKPRIAKRITVEMVWDALDDIHFRCGPGAPFTYEYVTEFLSDQLNVHRDSISFRVQLHLIRLSKEGVVRVIERGGRGTPNIYAQPVYKKVRA